MYIKEDDLKLNEWQFSQRKYLPYETKLRLTRTRIREWYDNWDGQVYLSYSGGLDSTVLLHLIRKELGDSIPAVFCNTGLEFPEIVQFARKAQGVFVEIKPKMNFRQTILKYGYPVVSKETANKIRKLRHGNLGYRHRNYLLNGDERGKLGKLAEKWKPLIDAPFDTSEQCCDVMKKRPFRTYYRQSGRVPYLGTTQDEGIMRARKYAKTGCNVYDAKTIKSQPIGFWTKQDVLRYAFEAQKDYDTELSIVNMTVHSRQDRHIRKAARKYVTRNRRLDICSVYGEIKQRADGSYYLTGEQRTGCMFCMFGCHLEKEPNRFQRMERTHPKLYQYCMKSVEQGGLGLTVPLKFIGCPYSGGGQLELDDYINRKE